MARHVTQARTSTLKPLTTSGYTDRRVIEIIEFFGTGQLGSRLLLNLLFQSRLSDPYFLHLHNHDIHLLRIYPTSLFSTLLDMIVISPRLTATEPSNGLPYIMQVLIRFVAQIVVTLILLILLLKI